MACVILVALGSNLADAEGRGPLDTCRWAVAQLAAIPGLRLDAVSAWYRTAPVPPSGQPDFVNGVARLSGAVTPESLLARLHAIEAAAGRQRSLPNAARTLDLDLLAMDGEIRTGPQVILPHPRLAARAFVLRPLCDVAPGWLHPVLGHPASALLAAADASGVHLLVA